MAKPTEETRERRSFHLVELRVSEAAGDEPPAIEGYAAVFNAESEDLGGFREVIRPGSFKKTIGEADVRALINHDPTLVIGRTRAKTLDLREDIHGLRVKITPPDTSYARDLMESMRRGDIDQMSFGFETVRDEWHISGEEITRTLLEVRLFDVSVVTYPAYPQTSAQVRSHVSELQSQNAAPPQEGHPAVDAVQAQARRESQRRRLAIAEAE
jgi:HK97 family phage prohead protease